MSSIYGTQTLVSTNQDVFCLVVVTKSQFNGQACEVEVGSFSAVRHAACYFTQPDT